MRGPKVSITTALDCHPSTYRLFYCESTLMGHALVGRSIILPANPRSVHRLAKELPLASEPPAPPYPHLRNQGSARAACTARGPRAAARSCARSVPRAARARTLWPDSRAPRKPPSPNLNPSRRAGRSFSPNARQSAPSNVCPPSSQRLQARSARLSALIAAPAPAPVPPQPLPMWAAPPTLQFQCKHAVVDPALQPLPDPTPLALGGKPLTLLSVQHRRPWAKSHCLSLPPSLPPTPLRPSSAGPRRPRPPPPARTGLALLRRPAQARALAGLAHSSLHVMCSARTRTRASELTMYCFGLQ